MFVTMATLGYGDYFPTSYGGKVIGMASCFWGVFTLSTMVIVLNSVLDFSDMEKKAFHILIRMKLKDNLRINTVNVIMASQKHKFERSRDDIDYRMLSSVYT